MVGQKLREVMTAAVGAGRLEGPAIGRGSGQHPVCGDEVEVDVRFEHGRIAELRWRASGCPATMAVAAVAAQVLVGVAPGDAAERLRAGLLAHGDLAAHEHHAEAMFLRALAAAAAGGS